MSDYGPDFFRKYADIIKEAEQPEVLTEGVLNSVMQYAKKAIQKAPPNSLAKLSNLVARALNKPINQLSIKDLTMANAKKVLAANQQLSEEEFQNPRYTSIDQGYELADIPNTIKQNRKANAIIGGVIGTVFGTMTAAAIPGLMTIGLPIMGLMAIAGAILGAAGSSPDQGYTGRYKRSSGDIENTADWDPEHRSMASPPERDPRFNQNI